MKKTMLMMSMAVLFVGHGLNASESLTNNGSTSGKTIQTEDLSSFCRAIVQGDIATVERLIALGEDVNKKSLGMTPVMFAARYNRVAVLRLLIQHGADLKIKSNQGFSVKKYAELANATAALAVLESA